MIVFVVMNAPRSIISQWLLSMNEQAREHLLGRIALSMMAKDVPVEGIVEQLAAGLLSACAEDMGLSPMELRGLLRTPRRAALTGLVTALYTDV